MCSYYRKFIKDFAKISGALNSLLKDGVKFLWSLECDKAFRALKLLLVSAPVLAYPDFTKPFLLTCDASGLGLGAILSQEKDGKRVAIAYASRTLLNREKNYATTERECLAIVWGIEQFRNYLYGTTTAYNGCYTTELPLANYYAGCLSYKNTISILNIREELLSLMQMLYRDTHQLNHIKNRFLKLNLNLNLLLLLSHLKYLIFTQRSVKHKIVMPALML